MPIWGTGPPRTDELINPQINATPYTLLPANYPRNRSGGPIMGYRFLPYSQLLSNYGLWFDAMDTSTIKDTGGNFPPLLPPNALGIVEWRDKSANARHLVNRSTNPSFFNLLGNNFYPNVNSPGYTRVTDPNSGYNNLRGPPVGTPVTTLYNGSSISAFFVLSIQPNANNNTFFSLTSTTNTMPIPTNPNGPNPSTFDFSLNYISNTIGFSRFGGGSSQFGTEPIASNNILTAPLSNITSTNLISIQINPNPTTIGSVIPSTNTITINGAFVSSSTQYVGNPFNFIYYSMFGAYNFPANSFSYFNEVGIFYRTLTTRERLAYESQLIRKWGISSNAPINVPVTSGLNLWLDAYDTTTITYSTNTTLVTRWSDKSLCNFSMSNPGTLGASKMPTYTTVSPSGLPSLQFSNAAPATTFYTNLWNSNFTYPLVRETTLFVTYSSTSNAGFYGPLFTMLSNNEIFYNTGNGFEINVLNGNGAIGLVRSTVRIYTTLIPSAHNNTTLASVLFNSSFTNIPDIPQRAFGLSRNGMVGFVQPSSLISSVGFLSTLNFTVNQGVLGTRGPGTVGDQQWYYSGFIHEVLQYNRALTFSERQQVESYLMSKWRI